MAEPILIPSGGGEPFKSIQKYLSSTIDEVVIFSPFLKVSALKKLALPEGKKISIVTTLRVEDLYSGVSDIDLYNYAGANSINLFINNSIHLKAYVRDWSSCIFGSSNLTNRGLATESCYNLELNAVIDGIDIDTIIYFKSILNGSIIMSEDMYKEAVEKLSQLPPRKRVEDLDLAIINQEKDYLISSLPMSRTVSKLYDVISNDYKNGSEEDISCAIHDSVLFEIRGRVSFEQFKESLAASFFKSKFIIDLLEFIDIKERYFGEVKQWIQQNCKSVPVPSRRDLTGNIQVLYVWITELSKGQYVVDRPGHSERIYRSES